MPGEAGTSRPRVPAPAFDSEEFEMYMAELSVWKKVCGIPSKEQGMILWYSLPAKHASDIKSKIINEVGLDNLEKEDGVDKFVEAMESAFKAEDEVKSYDVYKEFFVDMKRKEGEKIRDFINRFERLATIAKKNKMEISETVKAFKILDDSNLSKTDKLLVMSEIDFKKPEETFKNAKSGLKKYITDTSPTAASEGVKLVTDSAFTAKVEEVLVSRGWGDSRPRSGAWAARGGGGGAVGRGRGGGRGRPGGAGGAGAGGAGAGVGSKKQKPINPKDEAGEYLTCISCGSFRHMLQACPDSWENLQHGNMAEQEEEEEEESYFTASMKFPEKEEGEYEDLVLYTGSNKKEICSLGSETLNSLIIDCGCTSNVCGQEWMDGYIGALSNADKALVKEEKGSGKRFRFGGDEVLTPLKMITFPAMLGGRRVNIKTHVVSSKIPLLWSKAAMKKAGVVLDLPQDRAKVFGQWVDLDLTSVGHYSMFILPMEDKLEEAMVTLPQEAEELEATILKIHRQFGHPGYEVMKQLLEKAQVWSPSVKVCLDKIHEKCKICKQFSQTPPRPVVSLPAACEFNKVITMDLKEVKVKEYKYILHIIDVFTRLTVSVFLKNKQAETVVHHVMKSWVAVGYGAPKKCWSDVGGEFNNNAMREMGEQLGCRMETGAGYSAWMNGLNERNHAIVDRCFEKIMLDSPGMDPDIALAWAVNAKNSFPMYGGYSSYQLVFGHNPDLPNLVQDRLPALSGVTTSQSLAKHLQALHSARTAFTATMCDQKLRTAMRHKVRAVERHFNQGEQVYYRRDGDKAMWRGPATVLGNKGSVFFLVHQGQVLRVSSCRMVSTEEAAEQQGARKKEGGLMLPRASEVSTTGARAGAVPGTGAVEQWIRGWEENTAPLGEDDLGTPHHDLNHPEMAGEGQALPVDHGVPGAMQVDVEAVEQVVEAPDLGAGPERTRGRARSTVRVPGATRYGYPRKGDRIEVREEDGQDWRAVDIISRGGKSSSKVTKDLFNVKEAGEVGAATEYVYLDRKVWRFDNARKEVQVREEDEELELTEEALLVLVPKKDHFKEECVDAKEKELKAWVDFKAYEEVQDQGQEKMSHRWVVVEKEVEGATVIKARLVCRGFEEQVKVQRDSPTGSKETFHILLAISATYGWDIKSLDVKNAFLQGEGLDREVYMEPPPELKKPGMVWRLLKSVYGMNDAGRRWFFRVQSTLNLLQCGQSKLDRCLFFYHEKDGTLGGIIIIWVDDFFYSGTKKFEDNVISKLENIFKIGRVEHNDFVYTGLAVKKDQEGITLNQSKYTDKLQQAVLRGGLQSRPLDKEEQTLYRKLTGQLNWAATQTRPDMSYTVVELSMMFNKSCLEDLKRANKSIVKLKSEQVHLRYPKLTGSLKLVTFCDAAFRNLPDQISSGTGHIVFLADSQGRSAPLGWKSNKAKRVVGSTVAAEGLSLQQTIDHAFYLRAILAEILKVDQLKIPIISFTDSRNLYDGIFSTKGVEDLKLRCDIAQMAESVEKEGVELRWIPGSRNISDCLTKKGASCAKLLETLRTGRLEETLN